MSGSVLSAARRKANQLGGACLSTSYHKDGELSWVCAEGHRWTAVPKLVMNGAWCHPCAVRSGPEATLAYLKGMAKARGGKCLSSQYLNIWHYLEWECVHGHRWWARPGHVKNKGSWCPTCARKGWLGIGEMQRTAAEKGGKCLSPAYTGNHRKLQWQCAKGHTWMAEPAHIRSGQWCPHRDCRYASAAAKLRGDISEMRRIAELRGGELVSTIYMNRNEPLKWRCAKGHTWLANAANVKFGGTWCPKCPRSPGAKAEFKKRLNAMLDLPKKDKG